MNPDILNVLGAVLHMIGWAFLPFLLLPILCLAFPKSGFLNSVQYHTTAVIDGFNTWIGEAVKWLLVILVVSVVGGVIALSIFGLAWTKLDESATYLHASIILLGSAATLLAGKHVRVDIFFTNFSARKKALVDIIGFYALLVPFCIILIWNAQNFVHLAWISLEGSPESDGIRGVFLLKTFVSVFALMMLAQGLAIAGRAALFITGNPQPDLPKMIELPFEPHHVEDGL
jgi:TRAP-type mannitol/chloroaromatic compound transport system permease small subunit